MVLFQPPTTDPTPFDVGEYRWAPILLWIVAIVGIVWGFLLIVDYINQRKKHYLLWGASFSIMWIAFHQVISSGDYNILLNGFMSTMLAFVPGLLAAGLIMAVYKDKKWGDYYALFVLVAAILIGIFKFDPFYWFTDTPIAVSIMVMVLHIPSAIALIVIPIMTTLETKETRWPAEFLSIGGLLMGFIGFLLALATTGAITVEANLFFIFGLFPIILLFAVLAFALGTLIPAKWNFEIPGIEFEERA